MADKESRAQVLSLRLRQRQLGRELRLFYERLLSEPFPVDMIESLRAAGEETHDREREQDCA